jgi:hypothetical protein
VHRDQSVGYEGDCKGDLAGVNNERRRSISTLGGTLYVSNMERPHLMIMNRNYMDTL